MKRAFRLLHQVSDIEHAVYTTTGVFNSTVSGLVAACQPRVLSLLAYDRFLHVHITFTSCAKLAHRADCLIAASSPVC